MPNIESIEKLLMEIDFDIEVEREPKFFSYAPDKIVYFGDKFTDEEKDIFMSVYADIGLFFDCSMETFVVLHEVGHIMTLSHLPDIEKAFIFHEYVEGAKQIKRLEDPRKEFRAYVDLFVERMANEWAIAFIQKDPDLVERLDKAVKKYYESEVF